MTKEEAIKFLQQLYPNGGHCWLDEQRIEAIGMAIKALQEEPVSEDLEEAAKHNTFKYVFDKNVNKTLISELKYIGDNSFKDGAQWQKDQLMAKAVDGEVGYWNLRGLSINTDLPRSVSEGDKVKIIVIKED